MPDDKMHDAQPKAGSDSLETDLMNLRTDLDALKADVAALGRGQMRRMRKGAEDLAQAGEEQMNDIDDRLSGWIRERPLQAAGLAFGFGYLLAKLRG